MVQIAFARSANGSIGSRPEAAPQPKPPNPKLVTPRGHLVLRPVHPGALSSASFPTAVMILSLLAGCGTPVSGLATTRVSLARPLPQTDIRPDNISGLTEIGQLGNGWPSRPALTPNGKVFGLATALGLYLYSFPDLTLLRMLPSDTPVLTVAFSSDSALLAQGGSDGTITVVRVASGERLFQISAHPRGVRSLAFSPNGNWLASGSEDGTVKVWDLPSGDPRFSFGGVAYGYWGYGVRSLAFTPDSQLLIAGGDTGYVSLWDMTTGDEQPTLKAQSGLLFGVAVSPDGRLLASASSDGTVALWDLSRRTTLRILSGHPFGAWSVAFSESGTTIAVGAADGTVRLWQTSDGKLLATVHAHDGVVDTVLFTSDGTRLITASSGYSVKMWSLPQFKPLPLPFGFLPAMRAVAFSPNSSTVAAGSDDGFVRIWQTILGRVLELPPGSQLAGTPVIGVSYSADGQELAAAHGTADTVVVWKLQTDQPIAQHKLAGLRSMAFNPDQTEIALGAGDLELWDFTTGSVRQITTSSIVTALAYAPAALADKRTPLLAAGGDDGSVTLWDPATGGSSPFEGRHAGSVTSVAFSKDSLLLATAGDDGIVKLWSVADRRLLVSFSAHSAAAMVVTFSATEPLLASGGMDDTARLWNASTQVGLGALPTLNGWVFGEDFSSDGRLLATASWDGTLRLWGISR